jgi:hypothetical protein
MSIVGCCLAHQCLFNLIFPGNKLYIIKHTLSVIRDLKGQEYVHLRKRDYE